MAAKNRLNLTSLHCVFPIMIVLGCSGKTREFEQPEGDAGEGAGGSAGKGVVSSGRAGSSDSAGSDSAGSDSAGSDNAGSDGAGTGNSGGWGGTINSGGSGGASGGTINSGGSGGACQVETDPTFCQRLAKTCGSMVAKDNCGNQRTATCGSCASPSTCGVDNTCMACLQETNSAFCARLGKTCGSLTAADNCGVQRTATCGVCSGSQACGDKNVCIEPLTCTGTSASGPFSIYNLVGAVAPVPAGGSLVDGFYLATTANYYGTRDSVEGGSIEVKSGTVRKSRTVYGTASNNALTGYTFAGTYMLADKNIVIASDNCTYGGTLMASYGYSSSATIIKLFDTVNGAVAVTTYQLQP